MDTKKNESRRSERLHNYKYLKRVNKMAWNEKEEGLLLVLYDEGLTHTEMADVLNSTFGTYKTHKSIERKLSRLRDKYNLPTKKEVKESKTVSSPPVEEKMEVKTEIRQIEKEKVDIPPTQKTNVKSKKVKKVQNTTKRRSRKNWTVAEDMILIAHYGRTTDEDLSNELGRTLSSMQYRYRKITADKAYVGNLVIAGLENSNLNLKYRDGEVVAVKKPSRFKLWRLKRMEKKALKAQVKATKLQNKVKGMKE